MKSTIICITIFTFLLLFLFLHFNILRGKFLYEEVAENADSTAFESECELERRLINLGLVDIQSVDSTIIVELVNTSTNNLTREDLYGCLEKAYVLPDFATKLKTAQYYLKMIYPLYSLKISDAARPLSVQVKLWEKVKGTKSQKFIADPSTGSMHNYGAAVDVTIVDENHNELDMGSGSVREVQIVRGENGSIHYSLPKSISDKQSDNRKLLSDVMKKAGCYGIKSEWWHFNAFTRVYTMNNFKIIE